MNKPSDELRDLRVKVLKQERLLDVYRETNRGKIERLVDAMLDVMAEFGLPLYDSGVNEPEWIKAQLAELRLARKVIDELDKQIADMRAKRLVAYTRAIEQLTRERDEAREAAIKIWKTYPFCPKYDAEYPWLADQSPDAGNMVDG